MQLRCYRCGWSFAIKKDEMAFALEALEESGGSHYDSRCPRCRHTNRVSIEQLRKAAPRTAQAEAEPPAEASSEPTAEPNVEAGDGAGEDQS